MNRLKLKLWLMMLNCSLFIISCSNQETVPAVFKSPTVEVVSAYSVSETNGEVTVSFSEVYQTIPEVGIVWADKVNPTITDKSQTQELLKEDTEYTFSMPDLQKNKTYYIRGYYKLNNEITYSKEIAFVQNYSDLWTKVTSPRLGPNEYVSPDDVMATDYGNNFRCYKVNRLTNNSVLLAYYKHDGGWNPTYIGNQLDPKPLPRQMLYNPIYVQLESASKILTLYGAGYNQLPQNRGQVYKRAMYVLESDGVYEPYPGADARTSAFGIGQSPYVLENIPNGKVWTLDYSTLKWVAIGKTPNTKPARLITFDIGQRAFLLIEPEDPAEASHEFYEYIVAANRWKRLANFVGEPRRNGSGITIGDKIYFGLGMSVTNVRPLRDIWEYNISQNSWTKKTDYPGNGTVNNFVVNDYIGYVGFGQQYKSSSVGGNDYKQANDLWQFSPN
jgi:hypothetical protein